MDIYTYKEIIIVFKGDRIKLQMYKMIREIQVSFFNFRKFKFFSLVTLGRPLDPVDFVKHKE